MLNRPAQYLTVMSNNNKIRPTTKNASVNGAHAMRNAGKIFTIDDLSTYLKIPKSTLYKLARQGKIPGQKIGRHWRFSKDVIDQWLEQTHKFGNMVSQR